MNWDFLLRILLLLGAAIALGALAERLRQSAIIGYLLAGTLVAPFLSREHEAAIRGLAELGVALLLFSIGLEFSWGRLKKLGGAALLGGLFQVTLTLIAFAAIMVGAGRDIAQAVTIGAIVALSSTAVVLRTLAGRGEIDSLHGRAALGVLLLQDVAVVPLVLLVDSMAPSGSGGGGVGAVLFTLGKELVFATALVASFVVAARYLLPVVLASHTLARDREIPVLLAVVAALGSALGSAVLGLSPALGAFVAGVVLAESPLATQIRADVGALKTLFVTLFFSSIGMLADGPWIAAHLHLVGPAVAAVVAGKAAIVWGIGRRLGMAHRHAVAAGLCLAQIGEFSFVLILAGENGGLIGEETGKLLVAATLGTLLVTPYLVGWAPRLGFGVEHALRRRGWVRGGGGAAEDPVVDDRLTGHVIVIGLGPAGREVVEALESRGQTVLVIDTNPRTVMAARQRGGRALAGDAAHPELLEHARVASAREVVVTLPDHRAAIQVIRQVRALAPGARIVARARYNLFVPDMAAAGAHVVVPEESRVGAALAAEVGLKP